MITYAQNFEDVMLERLFREQTIGYYVDIGAWHPVLNSVTQHFYLRGWRGINVEPIKGQFDLFERDRKRDLNLNVAIADRAGEITFYECPDTRALSTGDRQQADRLRSAGRRIIEYEVRTITLRDLSGYCDAPVDFLKVDAEGMESRIFEGVDWKIFRPRVLVIEATEANSPFAEDWEQTGRSRPPWERQILEGGYSDVYFDGLNSFYIRSEDSGLANRLLVPPCVHDNILKPEESAEINQLRAAIASLGSQLEAVEADRAAKGDVVARRLDESRGLPATIGSLEHRIADRESQLRQSRETIRLLNMMATERRESIVAKVQLLREAAQNEVKRRAFGAGISDVLFRSRRRTLPAYGDLIPPIDMGGGLHVGIDTLEIRFGVSGGVETYMRMLVEALLSGGYRVTLLCLPDQVEPLRRIFGSRAGYFAARATKATKASIWLGKKILRNSACLTAGATLMTFSRLAEDLNIDVLHSPVQVFSSPDFNVPAVLNLHDLQHIHFPENFLASDIEERNHLYRQSANLADAIMVSSEFVRNDLITHLDLAPAKVFTVPVTWSPLVEVGLRDFDAAAARIQYGLPQSYGLFPAQFWPHKNHVRLLDALRVVRDRLPETDFKLVFTGYRGHSGWPAVSEAIARLGLEADVMCLDHVPAGHLAGLYKASLFCVMPSLFEASSYPVIEAQMLEVPAMCSNVTSLPELVRNGAGLLFDPLNPEDMAAKMVRWITDPADRLEHARRGHERVRRENSLACYIEGIAATYDFALGRSPQVQP